MGKTKAFGAAVTLAAWAWAVMPGCAHLQAAKTPHVERYGMVIGAQPAKIEEYKKLHAAVWPDVIRKIEECNIRNYSIYLSEVEPGKFYLFSYFEYVGDDFEADMAKMAADPKTQEWWAVCKPCQIPLPTRAAEEWWASAEEVFHTP